MTMNIVCDLDDCLLKTDLLYEQLLQLIKNRPLLALLSPFWLLRGRAYFKSQLAVAVPLDASFLPYRHSVITFLKSKKMADNTKVILASASPLPWVQAVANHVGMFDFTLGSSAEKNLKGKNKLIAIREILGTQKFCYIGDSKADLEVWAGADEIITVNVKSSVADQVAKLNRPTSHLNDEKPFLLKLLMKQLRPHQWIKNALVFLPALAGHTISSWTQVLYGIYAFAGFCCAASLVYVFNDLLDLNSDRNHHSKRKRPFASGDLPVKWGLFLVPTLLILALLFASFLPHQYLLWIFAYLLINIAYTFYFKQSVAIDIIILSMMYTLRIFAGSAATTVPVSEWLLSFSTLFFFSLACVKRYTEIIRSKNKLTLDGRGYRQVDGSMVQTLGVGSGLISILIILLYLQSKEVRALYGNPEKLWFATPILLFWISRIWIFTNRDEVHDDPVVFAVKDKISWICLLLLVIVFGTAT